MKISVEDGIVVCSLEDKNSKFMSTAYDCFRGFYNGKLRIHLYTSPNTSERGSLEEEIRMIKQILLCVENYGYSAWRLKGGVSIEEKEVEVDETVYERLNSLKAIEAEYRRKDEEERLGQAKREKWKRLCDRGCGSCDNLCCGYDDKWCKATHELLEEKNVPDYIGGVHHLFNYVAFPSESCPFKAE